MKLWRQGCVVLAVIVSSFILVEAAPQAEQKDKDGGAAAAQEAKGDPSKGGQVFAEKCQRCHYPDSEETNQGPGLKGLFKKPPHKMADGTEHNEHTVPMIREQILKGSSAMPPAGSILSDEELDDLIAYLQTL